MISTIESVTLGVNRLEPAIHLFRDQLGLKVVNDTRASVGLLSAWKVPVHESVRLVELANGASPWGRVRLAFYEDGVRDSTGQGTGAPIDSSLTIGPKAIDFGPALLANGIAVPATSEGLPVWLPAAAQANSASVRPAPHVSDFAALWLITADPVASSQFYCETFGFTPAPEPALKDKDRQSLCRLLGVPASTSVQLTCLRPADESSTQVVLVHLPGVSCRTSDHPMRPGWPGFNLISLHCDELDTLIERFEDLGIEPVTAPTHVGLPIGRPGRVMLVRGPNQELFEFTEIAA
jgi:catechol 2,3-dioxygenase-like lactoylglutathione lyase family enzyme